ncbi:SRPBCC family protein [Joostella sp.]|uniref:SRPBCC family protein n=1 Tax=Joostella sp. TaxID=2231138 RepID=UPI003A8FE377
MIFTIMYILGGVILLVTFLGLIAPKSYNVSRNIQIRKPLPEVFTYIKYLKNQDDWSPWTKKDPKMIKSYKGIDGTVGAVCSWKGNSDVGEGTQELLEIVPNDYIQTELRFIKPFKSNSKAFIKVEKVLPEVTTVVWGFYGDYKFPKNIFMIFYNMDKAIGDDFAQGLQDLKELLES